MPLHLLGKKSWNVYNPVNIARVKADEEAAAAREAAKEQRMQELDAERRAAILRGRTPPPLLEDVVEEHAGRIGPRSDHRPDRKRRKLAGEDDTDMDIRLAKSLTASHDDGDKVKMLKLRNAANDAPLVDSTGHIDLFPVDAKAAGKREKNAEAESEKKRKARALEDQYTMRLSNAAGKSGLENPWYSSAQVPEPQRRKANNVQVLSAFESKDVWGNEDPLRKEREKSRLASNDPLAVMQQGQKQIEKLKEDRKRWAAERDRELRELRATHEREDKRDRYRKRKKRDEDDEQSYSAVEGRHHDHKSRSSEHIHRHRSRSPRHRSRSPGSRSSRPRGHRHRDEDDERSYSAAERRYDVHKSRSSEHKHRHRSRSPRHRSKSPGLRSSRSKRHSL